MLTFPRFSDITKIMAAGKFIVFEGIDGSGSTTQAKLLHEYLLSCSQKSILTAEPSPGPIGNTIREIQTRRVSVSRDQKVRERLLMYLFAADRYDHLYNEANGILKLLENGFYVISTRYILSSFAYQVLNDDDYETVRLLNEPFPLPDWTVFLDCPVEHSLKRITVSRRPDLNEEETNLRRVAANFRAALTRYSGAYSIVDAVRDPAGVSAAVIAALTENNIL
jgi:dTMP kinase